VGGVEAAFPQLSSVLFKDC